MDALGASRARVEPTDPTWLAEVQQLLAGVLHSLEVGGIPYCLIGRPDPGALASGADLDLIVPAALLPARIGAVVRQGAGRQGACVVQVIDHESAWALVIAGRASGGVRRFIRMDFWPAPDVGSLRFYSGSELLDSRRREEGVFVPAPAIAFGCLLTRRLAKGDLSADHARALGTLHARDPAGCEREIARFWRAPAADTIVRAARSGVWGPIGQRARELGGDLCRGAVRQAPLGTAWRAIRRRVVRARHVARPQSGLHVVLLGPDGAGKSTLIDGMSHRLGAAFSGVRVRLVAPSLSQLRDGSYRTRAVSHGRGALARPHALPDHSPLLSLVKVAYWLGYYLVGHQLTVRPALAHGELVLNHRYLVDAFVDARRYRYGGPRWALHLLWRITPKPDLVLVLDAPPEVMHARKPELPFPEIVRQRTAYRELAERTANAVVVDAAQPAERVAAEAVEVVVRTLAERARRCLGTAP